MKYFYLLIALFFSIHLVQAQYLEDFVTPNKGINGSCSGSTLVSCTSVDFSGENYWTLGGNLSGIDSEGLKTVAGNSLQFQDVDELSCFISPPIDISSVSVSSLTVQVNISGGWEASDFGDVSYIVDGAAEVVIANVTGCGTSTNTFGGGCATGDGLYTASASGIVGSEITVMVCLDCNSSNEFGNLASVSVPEAGTIVPVTWNKFNATLKKEGNLLEWSTASELNNDVFEIQRSVGNASNFETIATTDGQRNSSEENFYAFLDEDVDAGTVYYYRIKQVDLDGKYSFSRLLSLQRALDESFSVGPNPFTDEIKVSFSDVHSNARNTITIYNTQGMIIKELIVNGSDEIVVNTEDLPAGIYYVSPNNGDYTKIVKAN